MMIRSPTRRVGYMEDDGMKRSSEKVDHKSTRTRSLNNPSRPGHRRNPQLWHGIHFSTVADVIKKLFNADGLKKLIVKCCGTKGDGKIKKDGPMQQTTKKMRGLKVSETEKERERGDVLCIYWLTQSCWGSFNEREEGRFFLFTLPSFTFLRPNYH